MQTEAKPATAMPATTPIAAAEVAPVMGLAPTSVAASRFAVAEAAMASKSGSSSPSGGGGQWGISAAVVASHASMVPPVIIFIANPFAAPLLPAMASFIMSQQSPVTVGRLHDQFFPFVTSQPAAARFAVAEAAMARKSGSSSPSGGGGQWGISAAVAAAHASMVPPVIIFIANPFAAPLLPAAPC